MLTSDIDIGIELTFVTLYLEHVIVIFPWSATVILSWWHHRISPGVAQCSPPGQWIIILVSTHRPTLAPVTKITNWTVVRKSSIHRSILIFKSVIICWISDILFVFPSYANSPVWAGDRAGRAGAASCWSWRNISVQADLCAPRLCLVCLSPAQLAAPAPASAWSLRPQLSALSLLLASAQSQSDCCADSEVITVRLHRLTPGRATCQHWHKTMADTKTANISKLVIKQAGRAKEKVNIVTRAPSDTSDILHTRPREGPWPCRVMTWGPHLWPASCYGQGWLSKLDHTPFTGSKSVSLWRHQPRSNVTIMHRKFCLLTSMAS